MTCDQNHRLVVTLYCTMPCHRSAAVAMYHKNVRLISAVMVLALLALAGCYSGTRPPRVGEAAPDFAIQDSSKAVALHDLKGQVVVLNFWATWCPPCIEEMPSLVEMQRKLKDKGVKVLAVSIDVDQTAYEKFLKDHGVDLLTVRDPDQKASTIYGSFKWPETYIIDRNGVVRRKFIGPVDWTHPEIQSYIAGL
jgi:cytochrome c biogenesis protein CcmG, thiol:disulfide interchange protein DsbE